MRIDLNMSENAELFRAYARARRALTDRTQTQDWNDAYFSLQTGCREVERYMDVTDYELINCLVVEFDSEAAYTMFLLRWR